MSGHIERTNNDEEGATSGRHPTLVQARASHKDRRTRGKCAFERSIKSLWTRASVNLSHMGSFRVKVWRLQVYSR